MKTRYLFSFGALLMALTAPAQGDPTALHLSFTGTGTPTEREHYLEDVYITFSDAGDALWFVVNGAGVYYPLEMMGSMTFFSGTPQVQFHANEDPDEMGSYYTTFYSGLNAYTLPSGVKAYTAEVSEGYYDATVVLTPIEGGIIPQGEAVLLYSWLGSDITMSVSDEEGNKSVINRFMGVDVATDQDASTNYMLSYGQNGLGFYEMPQSMLLSANKAFLPWSAGMADGLRMVWGDDGASGMEAVDAGDGDAAVYSLSGVRLGALQKGINIVNGKKIIR